MLLVLDTWLIGHFPQSKLHLGLRLSSLPCLQSCYYRVQIRDKHIQSWVQTSLMIGRQIILRSWKSEDVYFFQEWVTELARVAAFEKCLISRQTSQTYTIKKQSKYLIYLEIAMCEKYADRDSVNVMCYKMGLKIFILFQRIYLVFSSLYTEGCFNCI